jgi:hypothetical protein
MKDIKLKEVIEFIAVLIIAVYVVEPFLSAIAEAW